MLIIIFGDEGGGKGVSANYYFFRARGGVGRQEVLINFFGDRGKGGRGSSYFVFASRRSSKILEFFLRFAQCKISKFSPRFAHSKILRFSLR